MGSRALLFSCILSSLLTTGFSLSCSACNGRDETSCKGTSTPCPSDSDVCVATYQLNVTDGKELTQYRRACGPRTLCAQKESATFPDSLLKISSTCCYTSNCIPPLPVWPQGSTEKNGVSCMECQGSEDKSCTSSNFMACTGDEKQCASVIVATPSLPALSLRGCSTPGICNVTQINFITGDVKQHLTFGCSNGGGGLQHSLSLLIFTPMLLARVIG